MKAMRSERYHGSDDEVFKATRTSAIGKEERSDLVKHLWVLWTVLQGSALRSTRTSTPLFNEATKLAGAGAPKSSSTSRSPTA